MILNANILYVKFKLNWSEPTNGLLSTYTYHALKITHLDCISNAFNIISQKKQWLSFKNKYIHTCKCPQTLFGNKKLFLLEIFFFFSSLFTFSIWGDQHWLKKQTCNIQNKMKLYVERPWAMPFILAVNIFKTKFFDKQTINALCCKLPWVIWCTKMYNIQHLCYDCCSSSNESMGCDFNVSSCIVIMSNKNNCLHN